MDNPQSKLSSQEVFNKKKLFSNKIHARILKATQEILKSFDKLKIETEDKDLFFNAINHYHFDLCKVVFHLRQVVIQIDGEDQQSVRDLQEVISELNKIVLQVQESLNLETEELINHVKATVFDVGSQVEKLLTIIEYDNLHEHKQKILDIQHDLVLSIEALKLYCQCTYLTPLALEGLLHEEIEKIKNNLIQIKTDHEHMTEDFSHYTRHSVQILQVLVDYLQKQHNTENYPKDFADVVKNVQGFGASYVNAILEAADGDNPMSKMLDVIENCHTNVSKASLELQKGLQIVTPTNIGRNYNQKLKQLFIYLFVNGVNAMRGLNQSIKDAIMKK